MDVVERATVLHFHRHRIRHFGIGTAEAAGWVDGSSQQRRFDAIATAADFAGCSVLDLGCGTGALKARLDASHAGVSYLGIDQVPEFIAHARARYAGDPRANFEQADFDAAIFPRVDHVVACGALSYRSAEPRQVYRSLARMFSIATRTVIVSVLDAARFPDHPLLVGHDVGRVADFCRHLAPRVTVSHAPRDDDPNVLIVAALDGPSAAARPPESRP